VNVPLPASTERIVLIGFMGAGKSTVGAMLAAQLGWPFVDLDSSVAATAGKPVPQILADHGEPHFRQLESQHLAATLAQPVPLVLALGGGAIEADENRKLLAAAEATAVLYLEAPLETLLARCEVQQGRPNAVARPLIHEAAQRFAERASLYQQTGTAVPTESLPAEDVVQDILRLLQMEAAT